MIEKSLAKKSAFTLFAFFCNHSSEKLHSKQAAEKTNMSYGAAFKALRTLEKERLLEKKEIGRTLAYSLKDNAETQTFKAFLNIAHVKKALNELQKPPVEKIILYGSRATGENTEKSDYDIIAITKDKKKTLEKTGKTQPLFSTSIFTPLEWERTKRTDPSFYRNAENGKIIWENEEE
ncbi:MAG: nucleotidyltransferase domain-containing protein [Candidatus Micrarchaeia archaeon]